MSRYYVKIYYGFNNSLVLINKKTDTYLETFVIVNNSFSKYITL